MKKVICIILTLMLSCSFVACDSQQEIQTETPTTTEAITTSAKEAEFDAAKSAYKSLTEANEYCEKIMDSIYGGWHFAIYKADDYSIYYNNALSNFCSATGLERSAVTTAINNLGYSNTVYTLADFDRAIAIVVSVYTSNETYSKVSNLIDSAKQDLKSVTAEYDDYTGYTTLKSYYSEISSYFEFCKSPSGSFSQLGTTIDNYETNLRNSKNDLSFIFD